MTAALCPWCGLLTQTRTLQLNRGLCAACALGVPHPDDPGPSTPPAWQEQEWCDGGWSCQHPACLDSLADALDDMAQEASREQLL
jgi:hypothetical protein